MNELIDQLWILCDQITEAIDSLEDLDLDTESLAMATISLDNASSEVVDAIAILRDAE